MKVIASDQSEKTIKDKELKEFIDGACRDSGGCQVMGRVRGEEVYEAFSKEIFSGMKEEDFIEAIIMTAKAMIKREVDYTYVSARLLFSLIWKEVRFYDNCLKERLDDRFFHFPPARPLSREEYKNHFVDFINKAVSEGLLKKEMKDRFDLEKISEYLHPERDWKFDYLGLKTLNDRYLIRSAGKIIEMPQSFFMRVAMGLCLGESEPNTMVKEFYEVLSNFDFMSSTPTLFNSGTPHPQLSSCYLTSIPDSLGSIYDSLKDNALLSKFAGGLGNSWTRVRGLGAFIKGTGGKSQGVVPFMKVACDTAVAVNQGGRRKGAACAYLECWHYDVEEFMELRKNSGDDRRRTHDMNTAIWIPDLFMERVIEKGTWTLFSPDETPDLHDLYGEDFKKRYLEYEDKTKIGRIKAFKIQNAVTLWRKLLGMVYETGHPWLTFKDTCNLRSPQQHVGVVHSSNLCTEITLNTSDTEIAVCNLGSINLANHITNGEINRTRLRATIKTAIRMLDNVIDENYYPVEKARTSNIKNRPIGIGIMGFQDALHKMGYSYASEEAVEVSDFSMELISYFAIESSMELAVERGSYPTFEGSLWSKGILPIFSLQKLKEIRGDSLSVNLDTKYNWEALSRQVKRKGMRNSNVMAIAPTATIAGICGVHQSIEPTYQNIFAKSNLSGEFTHVEKSLVDALAKEGLWDEEMKDDFINHDGDLKGIERVPDRLKRMYPSVWDIDPLFMLKAASCRQKWIDQSQSFNIYLKEPDGQKLDYIYKQAWRLGLKTTYYLRSIGKTHVEKSDVKKTDRKLNAVPVSCEACE